MPRLLDRSLSRFPRTVRTAVDWALTIAFAVGFVLVFQAEVAKPFRIPTPSMEPALHCARPVAGCLARFSDRVIANRLAYRFRDPERGDIVVFDTPPAAEQQCPTSDIFVKRIIGLPGETWEQRDGDVFINGRRLIEPYLPNDRKDFGTYAGRRVPAGHYFVMGDNRSQSCDSRAWGPVPRENLIGPIILKYWPPQRLEVATD
jgi:signal peptidase I